MWSSRRGSRAIEHLGSAHGEAELEALKAGAQQRIAAGQLELALGLGPAGGGRLPITSSRMGHLVDALEAAYWVLGLEDAAGGDEVFRHLVLARIIEPVSKLDSLRVLEEADRGQPGSGDGELLERAGPDLAQIVDLVALRQRRDTLTISAAHRDVQEQVTVPERHVVDRQRRPVVAEPLQVRTTRPRGP